MKITIEINDLNELIKFQGWINLLLESDLQSNTDLNQPIELLELTIRTQNCLKNLDIEKIEDLLKFSKNDLLKNSPNLGKKSLKEITDKLSNFGLTLK